MALTKNNANTFYENMKVNFKRIERYEALRSLGIVIPKLLIDYLTLKVQNNL